VIASYAVFPSSTRDTVFHNKIKLLAEMRTAPEVKASSCCDAALASLATVDV